MTKIYTFINNFNVKNMHSTLVFYIGHLLRLRFSHTGMQFFTVLTFGLSTQWILIKFFNLIRHSVIREYLRCFAIALSLKDYFFIFLASPYIFYYVYTPFERLSDQLLGHLTYYLPHSMDRFEVLTVNPRTVAQSISEHISRLLDLASDYCLLVGLWLHVSRHRSTIITITVTVEASKKRWVHALALTGRPVRRYTKCT